MVTLDDLFPGQDPVLLDGAMGTALIHRHWPGDRLTALANLEAPDLVASVHESHRRSGARVLLTNTFGALLAPYDERLPSLAAGVRIARDCASDEARVAGCLAAFALSASAHLLDEVLVAMLDEGIDLLVFETCNTRRDAALALDAWSRCADRVPVVITASTRDGGRTDHDRVLGVLRFVQACGDPRVDTGLNCCQSPTEALRLARAVDPPTRWLKPAAPRDDKNPDEVMAAFAQAAQPLGARFVGGCCGTRGSTLAIMSLALRPPPP